MTASRFLAFFLAISLSLPNSALALRTRNGGLEEQTPTVQKLENALRSGLEEYDPQQVDYQYVSLTSDLSSSKSASSFKIPLVDQKHQENWRNKIPEVILSDRSTLPFVVWSNFGMGYANLGIKYQERTIPFIQLEMGGEISGNSIWSIATFMPKEWVAWFIENMKRSRIDPALAQFLQTKLAAKEKLPTGSLKNSEHMKWLSDVLDRVTKATVKIQQIGPGSTVSDIGSGTVVEFNRSAYILTAAHVVSETSVRYQAQTANGLTLPVQIAGEARTGDQAVLGPVNEWKSLAFPVQEKTVSEDSYPRVIQVGFPGDPKARMLRAKPHVMWALGQVREGEIISYAPRAEGMSGGAVLDLNTGKLIGVISHGGSKDTRSFPVHKNKWESMLSAGLEETEIVTLSHSDPSWGIAAWHNLARAATRFLQPAAVSPQGFFDPLVDMLSELEINQQHVPEQFRDSIRITLKIQKDSSEKGQGWLIIEYRDENPDRFKKPIDMAVRVPGATSTGERRRGLGLTKIYLRTTHDFNGVFSIEATDPYDRRVQRRYEGDAEPIQLDPIAERGTIITAKIPVRLNPSSDFNKVAQQMHDQFQSGLEEGFSRERVIKILAGLYSDKGEETAVQQFSLWLLEPILEATSGQKTRLVELAREVGAGPREKSPWRDPITPSEQNQRSEENAREKFSELFGLALIQFLEVLNREAQIKISSINTVLSAYQKAGLLFSILQDQKIHPDRFPRLRRFLDTWSQSSAIYQAEFGEMLEAISRLPQNTASYTILLYPEMAGKVTLKQMAIDSKTPEHSSERYSRLVELDKTAQDLLNQTVNEPYYTSAVAMEEEAARAQSLFQKLINSGLEETRAQLFQTLGQMGETPRLLGETGAVRNVAEDLGLSDRLKNAGYPEGKILMIPEGPAPANAFQDSEQITVYAEPQWQEIVRQNLASRLDFRFRIVDKPDQARVIIGSEQLKNEMESGLRRNNQTFLVVDQNSVPALTADRLAWLLAGGELAAGRVLYLYTDLQNNTVLFA